MSAATILFPLGGPRLSTIAGIAVLLTLAIGRREKIPAYACVGWLFGFEALFQATTLALGRTGNLGPLHSIIYLVLGVILLPFVTRRGARPSWPLLAAAVAVFAIWVATGFHVNVNEHGVGAGFDPVAEALNEGSKTLWMLAYLIPVVRQIRSDPAGVAVGAS